MGCDFQSKVRDRVRKTWRDGFKNCLQPTVFGDTVEHRTSIKIKLDSGCTVEEAEELLAWRAGRSIVLGNGLQRIGECADPPLSVSDAVEFQDGQLVLARVLARGQLTPTADVEVGIDPTEVGER